LFNPNGKGYQVRENVWLKKKTSTLVVSVLLSSVLFCIAFASVLAQQTGTNLQTLSPASGLVGSQVNVQGTIDTSNGPYLVYFGDQLVVNNTSSEFSVNVNFTVPNFAKGNYSITLRDVTSNQNATKSFTITTVAPSGISAIPWSTFIIMGLSIIIAFLNSGINRLLVSHFVGWDRYKSMQKEMSEYRSQQMAAMRANDKKELEKLKKKESQIMNMQKKMAKPQAILFGVSFIYIVVWIFFLTPTFGATTVAYLPGFSNMLVFGPNGAMGVFYWYPICSLMFGTLASRILGVLPME
jgi:uncharacterized membrane protein (DUF106 family)